MDVKTACLAILSLGDATGYEIKKTSTEGWFSLFFEASYGSIYPALNKLLEKGLINCREEAQEKRPDKKVYSITPAGRLAFADQLLEPPAPDRFRSEFLATMLFSDLLTPRHIAKLMDDRIAKHEHCLVSLKSMSDGTESPGHRFVVGFCRALEHAAVDYLRENRHVVESQGLMVNKVAAE